MTLLDDLVLADAPTIYWKLEESSGSTAGDASGNGNHGTITGAPTMGVDGPESCSAVDAAMHFPGDGTGPATADYVDLVPSPHGGTGDLTMEIWYRPDEDSFTRAGGLQTIMQQRADPAPSSEAGTVRVDTLVSRGVVGLQLERTRAIEAPLGLVSGRVGCWTYLACTRAGDLWTLYVNGSPVGTATFAMTVTSQTVAIGGDQVDVNHGGKSVAEMELVKGRLANFALYSGQALAAAAIAARWEAGCTACGGRRPTLGRLGFG